MQYETTESLNASSIMQYEATETSSVYFCEGKSLKHHFKVSLLQIILDEVTCQRKVRECARMVLRFNVYHCFSSGFFSILNFCSFILNFCSFQKCYLRVLVTSNMIKIKAQANMLALWLIVVFFSAWILCITIMIIKEECNLRKISLLL